MATNWEDIAKSNPYVAKALETTKRENYLTEVEYDNAVNKAAKDLADVDNQKFAENLNTAKPASAPLVQRSTAKTKLAPVEDPIKKAQKAVSGFFGVGGASTSTFLGDDGTTKSRFLG